MNEIKERINRVGLQILTASRNEIYMSMRYFDIALSALDYELNLSTKTIGTDGFKILFNPSWLTAAYKEWPQDIHRVYVHMLMHNIFRHMTGRMERDERLWNLSCDIAAESLVTGLTRSVLSGSSAMSGSPGITGSDRIQRCLTPSPFTGG